MYSYTTNNQNMKVDFIHRTIIVSKKFMNQASKVGTSEYELMLRMTRELPTFTIAMKEIARSTVTKKFMEDASVINSAAFKEMMALRKLGMAIVVREVKPRKKKTITYAQMLQYISLVENSEKYLATFHVMRAEAGSKNDRYNRVLSWFRKTFPDFYDLPSLNEKNEIIVKAAEASPPVETSEEKAILPFAS